MAELERSSLMRRARGILQSPKYYEGLEMLLSNLCLNQETEEYKTADTLFDICFEEFPERLSLKLLQVYLNSSNGVVRFQSIYRVSDILEDYIRGGKEFSPGILHEIKRLVISCLEKEENRESDFKILRRIVSCVAYSVDEFDEEGWDELGDCIRSLLDSCYPRRVFHVFHYLPANCGDLIPKKTRTKILEEAKKVLLNPVQGRFTHWNLALQTVFKAGVLKSKHKDAVNTIVLKSAHHLVQKGMRYFLEQGLDDLNDFLARDSYVCEYNNEQSDFVVALVFNIASSYQSEEDAGILREKLLDVVQNPEDYYNPYHEDNSRFDRHWYDHLMHSPPLEIFRIFSSTELEEWSREMAIRVLNEALSDHTLKKVKIDTSVMRQLQPLLIPFLGQQAISGSLFQVLGQVVDHVAYEMMTFQGETWDDLRNCIISQSQTHFERAVYIFQCLLMPLKGDEFVTPVIQSLLPGIRTRLNSPTDYVLSNSWILAFTGALCAIIHFKMITGHTETVKEIENSMIHSVTVLMENKESGLVKRAVRDVESIVKKQLTLIGTSEYKFVESVVKKQLKWLGASEYKFLKGLLRRLREIKDMTVESKMVLWRINWILDRGVDEQVKELAKRDID